MSTFPTPTLSRIYEALVEGFHGFRLSDGSVLTASSTLVDMSAISEAQLPFIAFQSGRILTQPWQAFKQSVAWDVKATLKVAGSIDGGAGAVCRAAINDLMARTTQLAGLPVDVKGKLVAYSETTAARFDRGEVGFLAERGAPYLTSAVVAEMAEAPCAIAEMVFHIEATIDLDRTRARVVRFPSAEITTAPRTPAAVDLSGMSQLVGAALGATATLQSRQAAPTPTITSIVVAATRTTLAVDDTFTLRAVLLFSDFSSRSTSTQVEWTSSDPAVATISSTGSLRGVSAGTATITATFNGVSGSLTFTVA